MSHPSGLGLYLRALTSAKHGSPQKLAKKLKDHHIHWVAIGGPVHSANGRRFINKPSTCQRYGQELEAAGIRTYVWGYPWQKTEDQFLDEMEACSFSKRWLLDPELGLNPQRKASGPAWDRALASGERLTTGAKARAGEVGMSTYGIPPVWFPTRAFARCDWGGGQTYTDNKVIAKSLRHFRRMFPTTVPNYGLYMKGAVGSDGKRTFRSKTAEELRVHVRLFLDAATAELSAQGNAGSIPAMIGWADNFMTRELWSTLRELADEFEAWHGSYR